MTNRLDDLKERLSRMAVTDPPSWVRIASHSIGGLTEIGYSNDSDLLLVISAQGRGLFNCENGERIARDRAEDWPELDQVRLTSNGIGPLADVQVNLAGLHGGGLPMMTQDGWSLESISLDWPDYEIFLTQGFNSLFHGDGHSYKIQTGVTVLRAIGFSTTGKSFVVATSHWLDIYARSAAQQSVEPNRPNQ